MPDEIANAIARLQYGRLLLEQQRTRVARQESTGLDPRESQKLLRNMEQTVAGMKKYVALLDGPETQA